MALQKSITTPTGVSAEYWKIIETSINWYNRQARFVMAGFLNCAARESNCLPLVSFGVDFDADTFPFTPDENIVQTAYLIAKSPPAGVIVQQDFTDALDC